MASSAPGRAECLVQRKSHPKTEKQINSQETWPGSGVGPGPEAGASPSTRDVVPAHSQAAWKAGEDPQEAFPMPPEVGKLRHNRGMGVGFWPLNPSSSSGEEGLARPPRAPRESPREERGAPEHPEFKGRSLKIWLCCSQPVVPSLHQPSAHFSEGARVLRLLWGAALCPPTLGRGSASTHRDWHPPCSTTRVQWVQGRGIFST